MDAIIVLIAGEDALAGRILETAEFYLETAIRRDDLGVYATIAQSELGRAQRLRSLVLVRWLRHGHLDLGGLREACEMKEEWNRVTFSATDWEENGFDLQEWMAEQIVLGEFRKAKQIADQYYWSRVLPRSGQSTGSPPEEVLTLVAECQLARDDAALRTRAEEALDGYYREFTDWGPTLAENEVPYDLKVLYAYVRGRFFKSVDNAIRLVKMMKFSE